MAHSKSKNWIHLIFGTKHRAPLIIPTSKPEVYQHLKDQLRKMKCPVDSINGMSEHIHILFLLHPQKALSEVIKQIKGGSSHAINQSDLFPYKFAWAVGYAAYSVSESGVPVVRRYIQRQKIHHRKRTYQDEYEQYLNLHDLD